MKTKEELAREFWDNNCGADVKYFDYDDGYQVSDFVRDAFIAGYEAGRAISYSLTPEILEIEYTPEEKELFKKVLEEGNNLDSKYGKPFFGSSDFTKARKNEK